MHTHACAHLLEAPLLDFLGLDPQDRALREVAKAATILTLAPDMRRPADEDARQFPLKLKHLSAARVSGAGQH